MDELNVEGGLGCTRFGLLCGGHIVEIACNCYRTIVAVQVVQIHEKVNER